MEASYWYLPTQRSHSALQKVLGKVDGFMWLLRKTITKSYSHAIGLSREEWFGEEWFVLITRFERYHFFEQIRSHLINLSVFQSFSSGNKQHDHEMLGFINGCGGKAPGRSSAAQPSRHPFQQSREIRAKCLVLPERDAGDHHHRDYADQPNPAPPLACAKQQRGLQG